MNQMIKSAIATFAVVVSACAFSEPAPGQDTAYANGDIVTNAVGTVQYRKFGKLKVKDAVVVDLTENVIAKGVNTWVDEDPVTGEEITPKDDIYGFIIQHQSSNPAEAGLINSYLMFTTTGFQYYSKAGVGESGKTYTALTQKGNVSNTFFTYGTNVQDVASTAYPKLELPKAAITGPGTYDIKQNGKDVFVSLNDVLILLQAGSAGKLTNNGDGTITIDN